jgi:hypothetical protein
MITPEQEQQIRQWVAETRDLVKAEGVVAVDEPLDVPFFDGYVCEWDGICTAQVEEPGYCGVHTMMFLFDNLALFATKLRDAVAEDLEEDPTKIHELILTDVSTSLPDGTGFPIYTVQLPDRNLKMFLWDDHCDGNIVVFGDCTLNVEAQ